MPPVTIEAALIIAISALAGAIGVLWRKNEAWMQECREERGKCEEALREVWEYAGRRGRGTPEPMPSTIARVE